MSDEHFINAQKAMNLGQREIFVSITRSIQEQTNGSGHGERMFITGDAGTIKTFVLNIFNNQVNKCYGK